VNRASSQNAGRALSAPHFGRPSSSSASVLTAALMAASPEPSASAGDAAARAPQVPSRSSLTSPRITRVGGGSMAVPITSGGPLTPRSSIVAIIPSESKSPMRSHRASFGRSGVGVGSQQPLGTTSHGLNGPVLMPAQTSRNQNPVTLSMPRPQSTASAAHFSSVARITTASQAFIPHGHAVVSSQLGNAVPFVNRSVPSAIAPQRRGP